jgi:hypothetical protein
MQQSVAHKICYGRITPTPMHYNSLLMPFLSFSYKEYEGLKNEVNKIDRNKMKEYINQTWWDPVQIQRVCGIR